MTSLCVIEPGKEVQWVKTQERPKYLEQSCHSAFRDLSKVNGSLVITVN